MKLSLITLSSALFGAAFTHISTEYHSDGSIARIMSIPDTNDAMGMSRRGVHQQHQSDAVMSFGKGKGKGKERSGKKSKNPHGHHEKRYSKCYPVSPMLATIVSLTLLTFT